MCPLLSRWKLASLSRLIAVLALTIGTIVFVIGPAVGLPTQSSFVFAIGIRGFVVQFALAMFVMEELRKRFTRVLHRGMARDRLASDTG